jgi:hypothetical protein
MTFWKREDGLGRELRASRPEPKAEFMRSVVDRMESQRARVRSYRTAIAVGLTVVGLVSLGAFGGLGYAASTVAAVKRPVLLVKKVVAPANPKTTPRAGSVVLVDSTAAADQYEQGVCHVPSLPNKDAPNYNQQHLVDGNGSAVQQHLRNHKWDYPPPCDRTN